MVIAPALGAHAARRARPRTRARRRSVAEAEGASSSMRSAGAAPDYVGQEVVKLSTTPVWRGEGEGARLEPRPSILRLYVARSPRRLDGDAGRLLPHFRAGRRARRDPAAGRRLGRCLGAVRRAGRRDDPARLARQGGAPPRDARRCRAGPPRTCSGSAAMSSAPKRRCASSAPIAGRLVDADGERRVPSMARLVRRSSPRAPPIAERGPMQPARAGARRADRPRRLQHRAAPRRGFAPRRLGHPRPPVARCLARRGRSRNPAQPSRSNAHTGSDMLERANEALRMIAAFSGLAQENMVRQQWLALPRDRPPHRSRPRHRPRGALLRPSAGVRRAGRAARTRRQPDHLSHPLCHAGGARPGDRSRAARRRQSARARLPGRAHPPVARRSAGPRAGRSAGAGRPPGHAPLRRARDGRRLGISMPTRSSATSRR